MPSPLPCTRAAFATISGARPESLRVGTYTLLPHQTDAVRRLRALLRRHGGAILSDETGLGKTLVALTLLRAAARPLVIAPASLRPMWAAAFRDSGVSAAFRTTESLSRGAVDPRADLIVVDEAHHFRNPRTSRYRQLARMAIGARVLLLTATPLHNTNSDWRALLALFLGAQAMTHAPQELTRWMVRRTREDVGSHLVLPRVQRHPPLQVSGDERIAAALLRLPSPFPGDTVTGALTAIGLYRLWSSSDHALRRAVRRRLARAITIERSLETGHRPDRIDLATWASSGDVVQLEFVELLSLPEPRSAELLRAVRRHAVALRQLLAALPERSERDRARIDWVRAVWERHGELSCVAFSCYAATVDMIWNALRAVPWVCALDAHAARIAGGAIPRRDALRRFAPVAHGMAPPSPTHRIRRLLATDLLSEGVNLQDAAVLIHLDLPWTPARVRQREGRLARLGSTAEMVHVYTVEPPAETERIVQLRRRLEEKCASAHALLEGDAPGRQLEQVLRAVRDWGTADGHRQPGALLVSAVPSSVAGVLFAVDGEATPLVFVRDDGSVSAEPGALLAAVRAAAGMAVPWDARADVALRRALSAYRNAFAVEQLVGEGFLRHGVRARVVARIEQILRRTPRHQRPLIAERASVARAAVLGSSGAGAELALSRLLRSPASDCSWLEQVIAATTTPRETATRPPPPVAALVLLG